MAIFHTEEHSLLFTKPPFVLQFIEVHRIVTMHRQNPAMSRCFRCIRCISQLALRSLSMASKPRAKLHRIFTPFCSQAPSKWMQLDSHATAGHSLQTFLDISWHKLQTYSISNNYPPVINCINLLAHWTDISLEPKIHKAQAPHPRWEQLEPEKCKVSSSSGLLRTPIWCLFQAPSPYISIYHQSWKKLTSCWSISSCHCAK